MKLEKFTAVNNSTYGQNICDMLPININGDYIPLLAINTHRYWYYGATLKFYLSQTNLNIKGKPELFSLLKNKYKTSIKQAHDDEIQRYFISKHVNLNIDTHVHSAKTQDYFNLSRSETTYIKKIRSKYESNEVQYYSGLGYLGFRNENTLLATAYCLTIDSRIIPYLNNFEDIKTLDINIPSKYLKLFVRKGLDSVDTSHPHLRTYYRRVVKSICIKEDIEIIEIDSFNNLWEKTQLPISKNMLIQKKLIGLEAEKRIVMNI